MICQALSKTMAFNHYKPWHDYVNLAVAVWLMFSPMVLRFAEGVAVANVEAVGLLLFVTAFGAVLLPSRWEEWVQGSLGFWLVLSPWKLGTTSAEARANAFVCGMLVMTMSLHALALSDKTTE